MSVKNIKLMLGGTVAFEFSTKVKTWGSAMSEIEDDVKIPNPHVAYLGELRMILQKESILPENVVYKGVTTNSFHIYITPVKSKSGKNDFSEISYRECKTIIKNLRLTNENARNFFGDYTHMTTENLRKILTKWFKNKVNAKNKKLPKEKKVTKTKDTKETVVITFEVEKVSEKDYNKIIKNSQ